ncbi:MAG TPA: DNA-3-methyladenine glycosylase [Vicinamibacterales bacterium]|nr:DNA-3-methyladenine glycosylase [Vicinamibacterales bacterium]
MPARRSPKILPRSFYNRPTLTVLEELIGKVLVHEVRGRVASGVIVEAEAYIGEDDPACHAAPGPTKRNAPLYGAPGHAYVYLNYGIHSLVNAVTERQGTPAAVLIRALEPLDGVELIARRRGVTVTDDADRARLCRGPGNLTVGLGITLARNRADLTSGPLTIEDRGIAPDRIAWSRRIGINVGIERPWRCEWAGHAAVSGRARRQRQAAATR